MPEVTGQHRAQASAVSKQTHYTHDFTPCAYEVFVNLTAGHLVALNGKPASQTQTAWSSYIITAIATLIVFLMSEEADIGLYNTLLVALAVLSPTAS